VFKLYTTTNKTKKGTNMNLSIDDFFNTVNRPRFASYCAFEEDNKVIIKVLAPEFEKADLDINITERVLEIKSTKDDLSKKSFMIPINERFKLTKSVDTTQSSANLKNGVLSVIMPIKSQFHKRKIEIY
jgi:HSP20 family molecular chaperone IbpA